MLASLERLGMPWNRTEEELLRTVPVPCVAASWKHGPSPSKSCASAPSFQQFKHQRLRWVTALWGALAGLAYLLFSIQQLARFSQAADTNKRAAAVDAVFSFALSISCGGVAMCAAWYPPFWTRCSCCAMGFLCSCWYTLGLHLVSAGTLSTIESLSICTMSCEGQHGGRLSRILCLFLRCKRAVLVVLRSRSPYVARSSRC
eukprot:1153391-Pelagomonas_calceolata.AAC.6